MTRSSNNVIGLREKEKLSHIPSANGYMFSILNKDGELGIRFDKSVQKGYMESLNTTVFKSHGATMQGYVLLPQEVFQNRTKVVQMLNESYDYVMSLPPK